MKKIVFFTFIFVMFFSGVAFGMTPNEFIDQYPNDFIYRVDYPNSRTNYISSPVKLEFDLTDVVDEGRLYSGKALVIENPTMATYYRLSNSGQVYVNSRSVTKIFPDLSNLIGYEGDINIYRWNGSSFFLPLPSTFLRGLVGQTQEILLLGFGIVSVILLIRLLVVYFRRYLLRLI